MSKPILKNNLILRSEQVLNALIAIMRPHVPLDLKNTRVTANIIIAVLGKKNKARINPALWVTELSN